MFMHEPKACGRKIMGFIFLKGDLHLSVALIFEGLCKNCTCADLEIEQINVSECGDNMAINCRKINEVRCVHEDACKMMYSKAKELAKTLYF